MIGPKVVYFQVYCSVSIVPARTFEKKWRDPDDVYIEVERREEERKKLGLPLRVIGSILPHSAVAQAEERWEAEQERKKKHPRKHRK